MLTTAKENTEGRRCLYMFIIFMISVRDIFLGLFCGISEVKILNVGSGI